MLLVFEEFKVDAPISSAELVSIHGASFVFVRTQRSRYSILIPSGTTFTDDSQNMLWIDHSTNPSGLEKILECPDTKSTVCI